MLKVWGFPEFLPDQQKIFDKIIKILEDVYKKFGFVHIQTPAVEKNEVLLAKSGDEVSKQIFGLYWLAQGCDKDTKDYSLHFDLTVPFARYILDHENELVFPFKRYQIQPVWRWERQQKWRYREFWQADIDVIWKQDWKDYIWYDIEVIGVLMYALNKIFEKVDLNIQLKLVINNKKIIQWFLDYLAKSGLSQDILQNLVILLDKYHKLTLDEFKKQLIQLILQNGFSTNVANKFVEIVLNFINGNFDLWLEKQEIFNHWIAELDVIYNWVKRFIKSFNLNNIDIVKDYSIVRGLDYYTWVVFETFIVWNEKLWSICSWWRYDWLTSYIKKTKDQFNWVWWSIWVNRLFDFILENLKENIFDEENYLIINFGFGDIFEKNYKLFESFINSWKRAEIYPYPDKLKKQFKYADKKWIRYVVIMGEDEIKKWVYKIKDMKTWKEEEYKIENF